MRPLLAAAALFALFTPGVVRANCARPVDYEVRLEGSTVVVQPWNFEERGCGGVEPMLRQDASTGATVQLAEFCGAQVDPSYGRPYLDECVPAGTYRYGFARPYSCAPYACGTWRWEEITVATDPVGCTRSSGNPGPSAYAPVGWGGEGQGAKICGYGEDPADAAGCATAPGASGAVLLLDAAALALGWALLRRRRRA